MCNIQFSLRVPNNNAKTIMIRKYFQMVFMRDDHKSLCIYTAIVFSGEKQKVEDINNYLSFHEGEISPFYIDCIIIIEDDPKATIEFTDSTESLWNQRKCMTKVWGKCDACETQSDVQERLKIIGGEKLQIDSSLSAVDPDYKPFYIEQQGKGCSHRTLVKKGCCIAGQNVDNSHICSIMPSQDRTSKYLHTGMESMVWLKAEIKLNRNFASNNFKYKFSLDVPEDVICYTPDFTLYFAPPVRYEVVYEKAIVDVSDKAKERNQVSFVANETTVNFNEWTQEEHIDEKNKCRVLISGLFPQPRDLSVKKSFMVSFQIENVKSAGNRQFLLGIIVSAILTFGLDYTRLNEIAEWISIMSVPPDIMWLLLVIPLLFALFLQYPTGCISRGCKGILKGVRWSGIMLFVFWFIWVFIICRIELMTPFWAQYKEVIMCFVHLTMIISFFCNVIYNIYCIYKRNYELWALIRN